LQQAAGCHHGAQRLGMSPVYDLRRVPDRGIGLLRMARYSSLEVAGGRVRVLLSQRERIGIELVTSDRQLVAAGS